jgi:hypothetical protein
MRHLRVLLLAWLIAMAGSLGGWLIGIPVSRQGSFLGAVMLGTLAILLAIQILVRLGWLDPDRRRGGSIGALCGFALAAPLAFMLLGSPLLEAAAFFLVGIGVVAGAGPGALH